MMVQQTALLLIIKSIMVIQPVLFFLDSASGNRPRIQINGPNFLEKYLVIKSIIGYYKSFYFFSIVHIFVNDNTPGIQIDGLIFKEKIP